MRPRRVLIVIPTLGGGGAERTAVGLANRLSQEGPVSIATFDDGPTFFNIDPMVARYSLSCSTRYRLARVFGAAYKLVRLIREERPDVCIGYSFQAAVLAAIATSASSTKSILCERSDPSRYPILQRLAAKFLWRFSDGAVYQSDYVANMFGKTRVPAAVIPNFLEEEVLLPVVLERDAYLLFIGRLEPVKDPFSVISSFAQAAQGAPHLRLIIIGEGSLRVPLERWVQSHGLSSRISFLGLVTDVGSYYQRARAFICASTAEGYPNALLEALAMGVPAVVVDSPTYTQRSLLSSGSGILVEPGDCPALEEAVLRVVLETAFLTEAIRKSGAVRSRHASTTVVQVWVDYIDRVLS